MILAFWALCFLSVLAVSLGPAVRQKLSLMSRLSERSQLYWAAEAGVRAGAAEVRKLIGDPNITSLKDDWARAEERFGKASVGEGLFSLKIEDEERKVNVNTASLSVMRDLFMDVLEMKESEAEELASSLIDWRDQDNVPLSAGAEDAYYTGLKDPYECKDSAFQNPDELLLVRGVTATIYEKIRGYVTIYGNGVVNINTAPRQVLVALGLARDMADKVLRARAGKDGVSGTEDDVVFVGLATLPAQVDQAEPLTVEETAQLTSWLSGGSVGVVSHFFSVLSRGHYDQKKGVVSVTAVFERVPLEGGGWGAKALSWRVSG